MGWKYYKVPDECSVSRLLSDLLEESSVITAGACPPYAMTGTVWTDQNPMPMPLNVIFNDPATIVYWDDGTKTVVKCQPGDVFSAETGLITAMLKKYMGNDNTFNRVVNEWLKRTGQYHPAYPVLTAPNCDKTPGEEAAG